MRIIPENPVFVWTNYWQRWSRILMMQEGYYLECNITPMSHLCATSKQWEQEVDSLILRWHCTSRDPQDHLSRSIPPMVLQLMHQNLSDERVEDLLHGDLFSLIDWDLFQKVNHQYTSQVSIDQVLL